MGNSQQSDSKDGKSGLPFYSRQEEYSPLGSKDEFSKVFKCSLKTRLIGFCICCGLGWVLSILGVIILLLRKDYVFFAVLYSFGQILNITGSCFLASPKTQFKNMTHKTRILLTIIYLTLIVVTIVLAFVLPEKWKFLVLISLIAQMVAYFFYVLSYIPFGRKILKNCFGALIQ